ncbi:DUF2142 domain-containing protein [Pantoea stewartii]|uniref:DUF2142 domain-containing protein n=1 Tax=Pantoea stewartii TaxID=66269 RepID=A0AB34VEY6_9GAMM|nr:DUF2142 domain-containing protein [Pantoea stewartii]KTS76161.1 hypothetical protein RSA30_01005 [Pantoea stewartii]KTS96117.1 hypothetical protein RSA13_14820 [Pantoea stewartii]KTT07775.1 hypothetical protein RSA36_10895 [Pantoea stewartii]
MLNRIYSLLSLANLHNLFLIIALPVAFSYIFVIFPLQSNDEWGHFLRSMDVSYGNMTDFESINAKTGVPHVEGPDSVIPFVTSRAFSVDAIGTGDVPANISHLKDLRWSSTTARLTDPFAVYPPVSYIFSSIGTVIGKITNSTYSSTLYFGRLTNFFFSFLAFYFAIAIASRGKVLLFLLLALPSCLSLIASYSQDAFLLGVTALTVAFITRVESAESKRYILAASLGLMIMILIRPHYCPLLAFFLLYLYKKKVSFKKLLFIFALAIVPSVSWYLYVSPIITKKMFPGVDEIAQLNYVLHNPLDFCNIAARSFVENWRRIFIPYIGPFTILYTWAQSALGVATILLVIHNLMGLKKSDHIFMIAFLMLMSFMTVFLITLSAYISWTPVKAQLVEGLQGRYLLPALLFLSLIAINLKNDFTIKPMYTSIIIGGVTLVSVITNLSSLIAVTKYFVYR